MKQMTIRNFDPELERGIVEMSKRRKWSLNQVALHLMRKGLGLTNEVEPLTIGNRLDRHFGRWSPAEKEAFDRVVDEEFSRVDPEQWS
jgi:hypothetical protein